MEFGGFSLVYCLSAHSDGYWIGMRVSEPFQIIISSNTNTNTNTKHYNDESCNKRIQMQSAVFYLNILEWRACIGSQVPRPTQRRNLTRLVDTAALVFFLASATGRSHFPAFFGSNGFVFQT